MTYYITSGITPTFALNQLLAVPWHPLLYPCSDKTVMVLARHWIVTDSAGRRVEVPRWSSALVGTRPVLEPGKAFEYYSRTDVETRWAGA